MTTQTRGPAVPGGAGDYDARAYAEVTRERVDNLSEQVERLEAKINTLTMLIIGQMLSFLFGLFILIVNHVKF